MPRPECSLPAWTAGAMPEQPIPAASDTVFSPSRVESETQDQEARNMLFWSYPLADVGGADPGEVRSTAIHRAIRAPVALCHKLALACRRPQAETLASPPSGNCACLPVQSANSSCWHAALTA